MACRLQAQILWILIAVLLFIIAISQPATCEDSETFHIIPSASSPCPGELTGEPCFTLSQYVSGDLYRKYTSDPSEIILEFQPGHHRLRYDSRFSYTFDSQLVSFKMNSENSGSTEIHCNSYRYSAEYYPRLLEITNVHNVHISGIDFVHCSLQVESMANFTLEESSFSQVQLNYNIDVLYIRSSSITIKGCNFTNNYNLPLHIDDSSIEIYRTNFVNNKGDDSYYQNRYRCGGGALLIENTRSVATISHCSFISNSAYYSGGVACIKSAIVSILNSTFSQNRAAENGGVFAVEGSKMTIYGSVFDNNTAEANGGVIGIKYLRSALFISHSSFTNNKGAKQGGVMYLGRKGSQVNISRSMIGFNNATRGGFATVHGSSLEITAINIFNNTAETGEVISACSSDISVSDQLITATDPIHSVCTFYSGNINEIDFEVTTTNTTEALFDTTTTADMVTETKAVTMRATTSQPTKPSITTSDSVYFELNGKVYSNNSVIPLSEVDENENALLCKTDLVTCCGTPPNRFGEFYYPNGDIVSVKKDGHSFYRNRGPQEVRLNRREGVTSPTGKFHCAVPDASGIIQNLFIHLLSEETMQP